MEIQFYHLLTTSLEHALPKLLEKAIQGDYRILVKCADDPTLKKLDDKLWDYTPESFLPHARAANDDNDTQQPILLTKTLETIDDRNLLVITDGEAIPENLAEKTRVLDIFNGNDESSLAAARKRWKAYKAQDHALTYIRQQPNGSWKKEA